MNTTQSENPLFFCMPSRVLLENGARHRIASLCAKQRWKLAAIVTDQFFSTQTKVINELVRSLQEHGISSVVFDGGLPDPSIALCDEATQELRAMCGQRAVDHVIAVGGGSNIDLAKAVCLTLQFDRPALQFVGHSNWPGRPLPLVALPTTAGTGSEITPGAILVQPDNETKVAIMGNDLRPFMAVVDPELTLSCPPKVTADAGLDALTHAIESWLTTDSHQFETGSDPDPGYSGRNRVTTLFAKEAVKLCFQNLRTAYGDPKNLQARYGMCYASLLAAFAYGSAGLNAVHGIAYALAGLTHASHGSTNAVLLPYVMDSLLHQRMPELAEIARIGGRQQGSDFLLARQAPVIVRNMVRDLGIPTNLRQFGVSPEQLTTLVQNGLAVQRLTKAYPRSPVEVAYREIVHNAYEGKLSGD